MRAITLIPGTPDTARLDQIDEPPSDDGEILVRTLALGLCGTDSDIVAGKYGEAPPNADRLVLGHEVLGEVISAPPNREFKQGDRLVGIVRRPDPAPCPACAAGEWDMCRNGEYTERGIKARHGFGAERFRIEPGFAVKVPATLGILAVLTEPASILAKGFDHIDGIGGRFGSWKPRRLLVTGAGPIGLLAALFGVQRGYRVDVFNRNTEGVKPALINDVGARHLSDLDEALAQEPDIIVECTGAMPVIASVLANTAPTGIVCLVGVGEDRKARYDIGRFNRVMVLENAVVFGTVNANRAHYETAVRALCSADPNWLDRMITRRVPLARFAEAFERRSGDIKTIIDFTA